MEERIKLTVCCSLADDTLPPVEPEGLLHACTRANAKEKDKREVLQRGLCQIKVTQAPTTAERASRRSEPDGDWAASEINAVTGQSVVVVMPGPGFETVMVPEVGSLWYVVV